MLSVRLITVKSCSIDELIWYRVGRASQRLETPRLCPFLESVGSTSKSAKTMVRLVSLHLVQSRLTLAQLRSSSK